MTKQDGWVEYMTRTNWLDFGSDLAHQGDRKTWTVPPGRGVTFTECHSTLCCFAKLSLYDWFFIFLKLLFTSNYQLFPGVKYMVRGNNGQLREQEEGCWAELNACLYIDIWQKLKLWTFFGSQVIVEPKPKFWRALPYVTNISEATAHL